MICELVNSALENLIDICATDYNSKAKAAKDIAAGGVLISSGISVIVAYFLFADKLQNATSTFLSAAISSRGNIFMTILFAIVVTIVILKGWLGRGEEYAHTGPSLNVALAFGLTTYASLITRSFLVGAVCGVLSLMIFVLKVTNTKARRINMVFSAALGILIVLFVYQLVLFGPEIFKLFNF
jgi:diacylglycerol kinase